MSTTLVVIGVGICVLYLAWIEHRLGEIAQLNARIAMLIERTEKRNIDHKAWRLHRKIWKGHKKLLDRLQGKCASGHAAACASQGLGPDGHPAMTPEWQEAIKEYDSHARAMRERWGVYHGFSNEPSPWAPWVRGWEGTMNDHEQVAKSYREYQEWKESCEGTERIAATPGETPE